MRDSVHQTLLPKDYFIFTTYGTFIYDGSRKDDVLLIKISLWLVLSIILIYPLNSLIPSGIHQSGIFFSSVHYLEQHKYHLLGCHISFFWQNKKAQDRWVKKKVRHSISCQNRKKEKQRQHLVHQGAQIKSSFSQMMTAPELWSDQKINKQTNQRCVFLQCLK